MAFLVFADLVAVWVFPSLIGLLSLPLVLGYWYLLTHTLYDAHYMDMWFVFAICSFLLGCFAREIVSRTLHLRETPQELLRFLGQFLWIVLLCELVGIAVHFAVALLLLALHSNGLITFTVLWLLLVCMVLDRLIVRTFLWLPMPEPDAEGETLRGQGLQQGEAVERRAWNDL